MDKLQEKLDSWNKNLTKIGLIKDLSKKTNIPPVAFIAAPVLLMVIAIAFDICASLCTCVIGVAYPTVQSIIALESNEKGDDRQWLTYWSIYGILAALDQITFITSMIPYYFFIKVCIIIWLSSPSTNGATTIYEKVVSPLLKKYSAQLSEFGKLVDAIIGNISSSASSGKRFTDKVTREQEELKKED